MRPCSVPEQVPIFELTENCIFFTAEHTGAAVVDSLFVLLSDKSSEVSTPAAQPANTQPPEASEGHDEGAKPKLVTPECRRPTHDGAAPERHAALSSTK